MKKPKIVLCHCCKKPSTFADGAPKPIPICWECIRNGGSIERKCSKHHAKEKPPKQKFETLLSINKAILDPTCMEGRYSWKIFVFHVGVSPARAVIEPGFVQRYKTEREARQEATNVALEFGLPGKWMLPKKKA